ncbi:MAG: hypothetical protein ABJB74_00160 [Gemmatimonas sp.]
MTAKTRTVLLLVVSIAVCGVAPMGLLPAQSLERFAVATGATVLPMSNRSGGTIPAAIAAGRVSVVAKPQWSVGVSAQAIVPLEVTTIAADCIPNVPCPTFQSPTALYGAAAEFVVATRNRKLRAVLGAGFLSAQNLSDTTSANSPTVNAGIEYALMPARRVSPVFSVRVQGLSRSVAGLRWIVLPTLGVVF